MIAQVALRPLALRQVIPGSSIQDNKAETCQPHPGPKKDKTGQSMPVDDHVQGDTRSGQQHRQMKNPEAQKNDWPGSSFERFAEQKTLGLDGLRRVNSRYRANRSAALMAEWRGSCVLRQA